ncbi:MAG: glycosyltransferase [Clostridiales Family XIII bacterium]|nr:glycosyltransferase [Clostridiales Family XIII bacterium]
MIITLVSDTFNTNNNGTTISAMRFAQALRERGHGIRILCEGKPEDSGIDPDTGFEMYYVPELWVPFVSHLAHGNHTLFAKPLRWQVEKAVAGSDVVHIYQPWPLGIVAGKTARRLGIPTMAAFHVQPENITWNLGLRHFPPAALLFYLLLRLFFFRAFKHIHCPSRFIAAQLRKHGYKATSHIISNGIHPDFCPDTATEKYDDGLFHILMVGRLSPEKRQDVLIRAAALSRYSDRIRLHFAGVGPSEKRLRRMARKLPHAPVFGYYGKDDLIELMRKCHLCVHASDIEIEGMGCMEAFSCGLVPIISDSRKSAAKQFALHRENLFRAGNAVSLAERIDYWTSNPLRLAAVSEEYTIYATSFTLDASVRRMEKVYKTLSSTDRNRYYKNGISAILSRVLTTGVAIPLLYLWAHFILSVRVKGVSNLRNLAGGAITVCNHVHMLDSALVGIAMFPRRMVFPTLPQNLDSLFPGTLVNLFGGVPVPERNREIDIFFDAMEIELHKGRIVHFFPEGHLEPYSERLRDFKRGAFRLAARARVPIIPLSIGFEKPRGVYALLRKKPVMCLYIGAPIRPLSPDVRQDEAERLQRVRAFMQSCQGSR